MEALLIIGALAAGSHYITRDDDPRALYSSQSTKNISQFNQDVERAALMAQVDWSKKGNFKVGESSENGVQWVFITN